MMDCGYNLEIDSVIEDIKKNNAKLVCLQLPDGLKRYATEIAGEIEAKSKAKCLIWLGSCFGSCDLPLGIRDMGVDLLIQFGHSPWKFSIKRD